VYTDSRRCHGKLHSDGSYEFAAETQLSGEGGARLRMVLADRNEPHRLRVLQSWLGADYPGSAGSDFAYESVDDLAKPFGYQCQARLERVARRIKDLYLVRVPWSAPLQMSGPMASTERSQPLVVPQAYCALDRHVIALPEGALPYATPDPVIRECDWGRYSLRIMAEGSQLVCERELRLSGGPVPAERFAEYQDFWRHCSWSDGAEIILRCEEGAYLAERLASEAPLTMQQAVSDSGKGLPSDLTAAPIVSALPDPL
jgi:hypothetical protein